MPYLPQARPREDLEPFGLREAAFRETLSDAQGLAKAIRRTVAASDQGEGRSPATPATRPEAGVSRAQDLIDEAVPDFEPRVRAWIVRRPPVGRLVQPITCLTSALEAAIDGPIVADR